MKNFKDTYIKAEKHIRASADFKSHTINTILNESRKSFSAKRMVTVLAAVIVLVVLFTGTVYAVGKFREVRLSESVEFSSATDSYAEKVDRSIEYGGLKITLSEALYENGKLYVTFSFQSEKYPNANVISPEGLGILMIDGKAMPCTWIGYCENYDGILLYTIEYDLTEEKLSDIHDFVVCFNSVNLMTVDESMVKIDGDWSYDFSLNVSLLDSETEIYNIGQEITLNNGDTIKLEKIVCTPLSQRIYYTMDNYGSYRVSAEGDGCEFVFSEILSKKGEAVNICPDSFDFDAKQIILTVTVCDRYENILADSVEIICDKK